jgi:hypothetical protein
MARYFIHLRDGHDELLDAGGTEHFNLDALHKAVMAAARDVLAGEAHAGSINLAQRIDVETEGGEIVHTLEFEDAVTVNRGPSA